MSPSMGRGSRRDVSTSPVRGQRSRSPKSHRERERERERSPPPRHRSSHKEEKEKPLVRHREEHSRDRHREEHVKDRHGEEHSRDRHREEHVKDRHGEEHNKDRHKERGSRGREVSIERSERRSSKGDKKEAGSSSSRSRHRRSTSPMDRDSSMRPTSGSPSRVSSRSRVRDEVIDPPEDDHRNANDSVEKMKAAEEALEAKKKEEPSFELSGKLAAETNRVKGVTLLFNEPSDARKPDVRWRLYVFKAGEVLNEPLYIHRQSCYLFGRERRVADVPTDHPSCSKQHAIIQFRQVELEKPDGMLSKQVRPYLMDLGSTNGTFLNEDRIEPQRYYELFEKDTIKFGNSSREYVILHENSA